MNTQFDNIANSYDEELKGSLGKFGGRNVNVFAEYKIKAVKSKLRQAPAGILEFGCGTGRNNFFMRKLFPESGIYGCDISEKSLEIAAGANPAVRYDKVANPDDLVRVYKEPFDCIFISNVFHHIPFDEHKAWIGALHGILSDNGRIFIFEHNPLNPITKHIFNNSAIDRGAAMLSPPYCLGLLRDAGFTEIKREYVLFFLWRNLFFETVELGLRRLPLGAQYLVWGGKRKAA